uniref:Uncharacterized protein n=1 Tax=Oncorhynchus kisutch TaxID=8019 RepID=A0A8C7KQF4_ONCKI
MCKASYLCPQSSCIYLVLGIICGGWDIAIRPLYFITGSFDRTCQIWDTASGEGLHTLEGHRYVVYAIISTGSFDKTCRMWRAEMGKCMFGLWDVQTGEEMATLTEIGHSADIISLSFNTVGDQLVTGSFDHTVSLWDVPSGRRVHTLIGHRGEISSVQFDWDCSLLITGSMDRSSRVTSRVLSASADMMARLWDGHTDEIFSSAFNYEGDTITGSKDNTCR